MIIGNIYKQEETKMEQTVQNLVTKLSENGVGARLAQINFGPRVTQYCFELEDWSKMQKIQQLFAGERVRIASVQNTKFLELEFLNDFPKNIMLQPLLNNTAFVKSRYKIPLAVGTDVAGNPFYYDLEQMQHILIAGNASSGKTMFLKSIIASVVSGITPDKCKLLVIDANTDNFDCLDDSPYLIRPVIKQKDDAVAALNWAANEVNRRRNIMRAVAVRNIDEYNNICDGAVMPRLVIIVDEFSNMIYLDKNITESSIQYITKNARRVGINLILVTKQTDVLTGIIRANFPTRASFMVSSAKEAMFTFGEYGPEKLLSFGDMMFSEAGKEPVCIHTPYVNNEILKSIVDSGALRKCPDYIQSVPDSDMYARAKDIILRDKKPTIAHLQRQMKIGYNLAAELMEQMVADGIVSEPDVNNKRHII